MDYLAIVRVHNVWRNMLRRCENPLAEDYANYGGRGIAKRVSDIAISATAIALLSPVMAVVAAGRLRPAGTEAARLAANHTRVGELLDEHGPSCLAVEDLYFGANARSASAPLQASTLSAASRTAQAAAMPIAGAPRTTSS